MIGYVILVHNDADTTRELLNAIYHDEDAFVISVDTRWDKALFGSLIDLNELPNVHVVTNRGTNWAGVSLFDHTLDGIEIILSSYPWIKYIIHLSGSCFPVKTREQLTRFLRKDTRKNYILGYELSISDLENGRPRKPELDLLSPRFDPKTDISRSIYSCLEQPRQHRHYSANFVLDPAVNLNTDPHASRLYYIHHDIPGLNQVIISDPRRAYHRARTAVARQFGVWFQTNWVTLTRDFCLFALTDPLAFQIYDHLRSSWMPEEAFFLTLIKNSPFASSLVNHSLTYCDFERGLIITENDIETIDHNDYFFARKFIPPWSATARARYKELMRGSQPRRLPRATPMAAEAAAIGDAKPAIAALLLQSPDAEWNFGRFGEPPLFRMRLLPGGATAGSLDGAISRWHFDEGAQVLRLFGGDDQVATAFDSLHISGNGRIYFIGRVLDEVRSVDHYLESLLGSHFQWAEDPIALLASLYSPGAPGGSNAETAMASVTRAAPGGSACLSVELSCTVNGFSVGSVRLAGGRPEFPATPTETPAIQLWHRGSFCLITGIPGIEYASPIRWSGDPARSSLTMLAVGKKPTGALVPVRLSENARMH